MDILIYIDIYICIYVHTYRYMNTYTPRRQDVLEGAARTLTQAPSESRALVAWIRSGTFRTDAEGRRFGPVLDKAERTRMHETVRDRLGPLVSDTVVDATGQQARPFPRNAVLIPFPHEKCRIGPPPKHLPLHETSCWFAS